MSRLHDVSMPEDWNDHVGWNDYYECRLAGRGSEDWDEHIGSIPVTTLPELAQSLKSQGMRAVWVPGCGISPLARLLAHVGLDVVATDIAAAAVRFQQEPGAAFDQMKEDLGPCDPAGSLLVELHDFRAEYRQDAFDLIINVKAIQGFSQSDMARIAKNHATALRKGRVAYFDTMNVQDERRDQLEMALEDGGFIVPFAKLNRWYRTALRETGIPHAFILGRPMIPRIGKYAEGGADWERDMARLDEIIADYDARVEKEQESERLRIGPEAKVAHVIYSTG